MPFEPVSANANVQKVESEQLNFWKENNIFHKQMQSREGGPRYVFYEGPPTANGRPGTHHVLARAFKDMFPRYKAMQGFHVLRKGGWDTHGLPVEIEVEKQLGFTHKHQIDEYGIAKFNEKCKESVFKYIQEWETLTERIAFWVDLDNAYVTFTNDYIQSVWWILRQFWDQGLLYQGYKVVPYCPRCGTPLSSHEVNLGYKDDTPDPSVYVRFKSMDADDTYFLVWTTTPWTLPGNVALAVGENIDYLKLHGKNPHGGTETLILAEATLNPKQKSSDEPKQNLDQRIALTEQLRSNYEIVERIKGRDLAGTHYEPLYRFLPVEQDYAYVVTGDFVSTEDGTGIVHIAPAFGADDMTVGRTHNLPVLMTVNSEGAFIDAVTPWAGVWVKDADPQIEKELDSRGLLFKTGKYLHTYPFCWRCDTALLYYARPTWYIRTSERRDDLVGLNQTINWVPDHIKSGRFGNWLENNIDWALGRERYWGTPLPVWVCDNADCDHMHCVAGVEELSTLTGKDQSALDLHRPYVDDVTWACTECGPGTMRRVPELIDVWFDSGAMPVAQWGYPYTNQKTFEEQFPADYICEAIDQTRGWFYSLHAISTLLFKSVSYKNVICLGHILDEKGRKASKSLGNVVDPWMVLDAYGADMMRWYMYTASPPGESRRFSVDLVGQSFRSFWNTLWNTYRFFVDYANLDNFDPSKTDVPYGQRPALDRYVLSELHTLVRDVTEAYEEYDVLAATRPIERFVVDVVSNWYVRRSRSRFWNSDMAAYHTLYEVLVTVAKLLAPTMPFLSDELYRNLVGSMYGDAPESVHLSEWPKAVSALIDEQLNDEMRLVMRLVSLGHAARSEAGVKVRQPLAMVSYSLPHTQTRVVQDYADLIADELNVKTVDVLGSAENVVKYALNPLPKVLGPRFGADFPKLQKYLRESDAADYARTLLAGDHIRVRYNGSDEVELTAEEVEVRRTPLEGYAVAEEGGLLAALDTTLTEDLVLEGLAQEFKRRVQTLRKDAGFNVDDHIHTQYKASPKLAQAVERFAEMIARETLSDTLSAHDAPGGYKSDHYEFDGEELTLAVKTI
jgi:isoleucyl-tRNA synthetase